MFGAKRLTPKEQVRGWKRGLKGEMRTCDREIRNIEREKQKIVQELKAAAKKGEQQAAKSLAKSMVRANKTIDRLQETKAQLNSMAMNLDIQLAQAKAMGVFQQSTQILSQMNSLVNVSQVSQTMQAMSREMNKAGLIQEMTDDAFSMMEDPDIEEEADDEVNRVMFELTEGQFGSVPGIERKEPELTAADQAAIDQEFEELKARRAALNA